MRPETEEAVGGATATTQEPTLPARDEPAGEGNEASAPENGQADAAAAEQPPAPMNRAERRARESGRKTNTEPSGFMGQLRDPGGHGPGGRNAFGRGKVRFPRTGHK